VAGVTSDDDARLAYLAEGNARQARKRVAADVLICDEAGRVLLVDPTYKAGWDLPGGMAEANEAPRAAAARELNEEVGLSVPVGRLLVLEWAPARGPWDDQLVFIFDGGTLPSQRAATLRTVDPELARLEFVPLSDATERMRHDIADRLRRACAALETGDVEYREHGT
jgi:8-oxo-dGTP pyrophosphatase MutT (NUDIX family)